MFKAWTPAFAGVTTFAICCCLPGCVTREDIRGIQTDLYNIQQGIDKRIGSVKDQTESVQTSQADLLQSIHDLSGNLTMLQTELNDYQQRIQRLSMRLDDLESSLTARMDSQIELLSGSKFVEKPLPSTAYNLANTDFVRGKYSEAITGFKNYIKQFPKGDKVTEARIKIGDASMKLKDSEGALDAYNDVIQNYPKDPMAPTALLRQAAAMESLGKKSQAKESYTTLMKSYPYSNEAKTAQDRLRMMQTEKTQQQQ